MKLKFFLMCLMIIFLSGIVSAEFDVSNYSIGTQYLPSQNITGWLEIGLNEEPVTSVFEDNNQNTIGILDLLDLNNAYYACEPASCETAYSIKDSYGEARKFTLEGGETKKIGLKISGNIEAINSLELKVTSDASSDCKNQLDIDFLADDSIDFSNDKSKDQICYGIENYGCYKGSWDTNFILEEEGTYCQRIELTQSPAFKLGVGIKKMTAGIASPKMKLYPLEGGEPLAECQLSGIGSETSEVSCNINYPLPESKEYYVCVHLTGQGRYEIKGSSENKCGFFGFPGSGNNEVASYYMFARGKKFDDFDSRTIQGDSSFLNLLEDYIAEKYNSDCSNDCVIPIEFTSGISDSQEITISNLDLSYNTKSSGTVLSDKFYEIETSPALVTMDYEKLDLDNAGFSAPSEKGAHKFSLNFGDEEILSEEIEVLDVPVIESLTPLSTASGFSTEFEVNLDNSENVINYKWDFGDNSSQITITNNVTHTYSLTGNYSLKVTVTDTNDFDVSKTFKVKVRLPQKEIDEKLSELKTNLETIENQISQYGLFEQQSLDSSLNLTYLEQKINMLDETNSKSNKTENEVNQILNELQRLQLPETILKTSQSDFVTFYPKAENIDIAALSEITGENYDSGKKSDYRTAVLTWGAENLDSKVKFQEFSEKYGKSEIPLVNVFELDIDENGPTDSYLVIKKLDNIKFDKDYSMEEEFGYFYMELDASTNVKFSTTENINFADLPVFVSPAISKLSLISSDIPPYEEKKNILKWLLYILIVVFLIFLSAIVYSVLRHWYDKKYEDYLFKDKNKLYNLIHYIHEAKRHGKTKKEIAKKLRKTGWSSEQVTYVMKKYAGKRTGMAQIPVLEKIANKFVKENSGKSKNHKNNFYG